ncbi:MAG: DinB family protein [Planctomycetota bacterium]
MPDPATLAQAVRDAVPFFTRFLVGFDGSNHTAQAPGLANHAAWTLGHLALYLHRGAEAFDRRALPASDFIEGAQDGDAERFATESVAFGSVPVAEPGRYPAWPRCEATFHSAADRFVHSILESSADQLAGDVRWGNGEVSGAALVTRQIFHIATHTGQVIDLRRALKMPLVVG